MVKITFPDITKEKAVKLVESVYGAMYWNPEKGKTSAYPFTEKNPVVIEHAFYNGVEKGNSNTNG